MHVNRPSWLAVCCSLLRQSASAFYVRRCILLRKVTIYADTCIHVGGRQVWTRALAEPAYIYMGPRVSLFHPAFVQPPPTEFPSADQPAVHALFAAGRFIENPCICVMYIPINNGSDIRCSISFPPARARLEPLPKLRGRISILPGMDGDLCGCCRFSGGGLLHDRRHSSENVARRTFSSSGCNGDFD